MSPHRLLQRSLRRTLRSALSVSPRPLRFEIIRRLIDCDPNPDPRLTFKIAETRDELEACFRILHDAYVKAGYMRASPSGLRVTIYHALPTTTTLCAKFDGQVVGTISIIREGVFGFPLQSAFDLAAVRARGGNITEISALAIDPTFRKTGGSVLFPLMKFMYQYCCDLFDTRHLVIAVNPSTIQLYEALLLFERLRDRPVARYAFANGAPAVGATLDLEHAPSMFQAVYGRRRARKNVHRYFVETAIANIQPPSRLLHLTNDPVMTPALLDHFFNRRTQVFASLDARQRLLLRSVYGEPEFAPVLPEVDPADVESTRLRRHRRFTFRCPATLRLAQPDAAREVALTIIDISQEGCLAEASAEIPDGAHAEIVIELGRSLRSRMPATVARRVIDAGAIRLGLHLPNPDPAWRAFVDALKTGITAADLSILAAAYDQAAAAVPADPAPATVDG